MKNSYCRRIAALLVAVMLAAVQLVCGMPFAAAAETPVLSCKPAHDWDKMFDRSGRINTWLGADGIYSVSLDGNDALWAADETGRTFFIFSDTLVGTSKRNGFIKHMSMPNHTAAILGGNKADPGNIKFFYGKNGRNTLIGDKNLFGKDDWMFDCFVTGGALYIFGFSQENMKPTSIDLVKLPTDGNTVDFKSFEMTENIPGMLKTVPGRMYAFGMAVLCNTTAACMPEPDGYIYIYGFCDNVDCLGRKDLIVARVKEDEFPDLSGLRYFDGNGWCDDIEQSAAVLENVSCEMSVTPVTAGPYAGKYIAVYTEYVQTPNIMYAVGDSPVGPFSEPVKFYTAPEGGAVSASGTDILYTYNAKAHPHLSPEGTLLVSYNVNMRDMGGNDVYVSDYHPRFLYLELVPGALENIDDTPIEAADDYTSVFGAVFVGLMSLLGVIAMLIIGFAK